MQHNLPTSSFLSKPLVSEAKSEDWTFVAGAKMSFFNFSEFVLIPDYYIKESEEILTNPSQFDQ